MAAKPEENLVIEPGITIHPLGPAVEIMQCARAEGKFADVEAWLNEATEESEDTGAPEDS